MFGKVKKKVAPLPCGSLGPNDAPVLMDDALHCGQTNAGTGKLGLAVQAVEAPNNLPA
jgi:hypothetical protein